MPHSFDDLLDQAVRYWHQQFAQESFDHVLILVNPFSGDPLSEDWAESPVFADRYALPIAPQWLAGYQAPFLVDLERPDTQENSFNQTLGAALSERLFPVRRGPQSRAWCAWIPYSSNSQKSAAQQAAHLGRYASIQTPEGLKGFRFYDPRIACHLPNVLTETQLARIFSDCPHGWHYMDESGQFQVLSSSARPVPNGGDTTVRLNINTQQMQALVRISQVNYLSQLIPAWELATPPAQHQLLKIIERAHRWGLSRDDEVTEFVHCTLTRHPLFDTHISAQTALQKKTFKAWASTTSASDWERIITETKSRNENIQSDHI